MPAEQGETDTRMVILWFTIAAGFATGLSLLCAPDVVLVLLLALHHVAAETLLVGRLAGAALLAIGLACWFARDDQRSSAQLGLLIGLLIYNVSAVVLLGWAGMALRLAGALLWPAVGFHATLAVFCVSGLRRLKHASGPANDYSGSFSSRLHRCQSSAVPSSCWCSWPAGAWAGPRPASWDFTFPFHVHTARTGRRRDRRPGRRGRAGG
jgi:hypothetical protein